MVVLSGTTNIVARIVRDAFGGDLAAMVRYARERLFDPAGMASALFEPDASGTFIGSSFAFMTARDWPRFGELFRRDGAWNGRRLLPEGWVRFACRKFFARVGQVTFSGALARERGQPVLYVTERCVFELRQDGVALVEVARGVDVERDILARLAFKPIVDIRKTMDERIFREEPMNLRASLLDVDFAHRIAYDAARDVLFVNLEAASIRNPADIEAMRAAIEAALAQVGRKTRPIVNYDAFEIAGDMRDAYADFVAEMETKHYHCVSRYTTSAFMRLKLEDMLKRRVAPHIFESSHEARDFLDGRR